MIIFYDILFYHDHDSLCFSTTHALSNIMTRDVLMFRRLKKKTRVND